MVRVSVPLPPALVGSSLAGLSLAALSLVALFAVLSPAHPSSSLAAGLFAAVGALGAGFAVALLCAASGEAAGGGLPPQAETDNAATMIDDWNRRATRMATDISGSLAALRAFRLAPKKAGWAARLCDSRDGVREISRL